jgi:hypothetical protein
LDVAFDDVERGSSARRAARCCGNGVNGVNGALGYGNSMSTGDDEPAAAVGDIELGGLVAEIRADWNHACARLENGAVRCCGFACYGALGYGNANNVGDNETAGSAGLVQLQQSLRLHSLSVPTFVSGSSWMRQCAAQRFESALSRTWWTQTRANARRPRGRGVAAAVDCDLMVSIVRPQSTFESF